MNVIHVPLARCTWIIDLASIVGGRSLLDALHGIAQHYRFSSYPKNLLDVSENSAFVFRAGTFLNKGADLRVGLSIYNDGIIADTLSSTDAAEALLEDVRTFLAKEYHLTISDEDIKQKAYISQVEVHTKAAMLPVNPKLRDVAKVISERCLTVDGEPREFAISSFSMWPEDVKKEHAPVPFRLERKWGKPFSEDIYYSQAPLRTQEHVAVLIEIAGIAQRDTKV